ncbi:hypothetical protein BDA96_08G113700 [Sorghum bicolor]|uniref:Peptidyl-prolyl cis-trans isomerase n=1 Tax=Sorghum bicolor TaxID=4558 RepID=A0A921QFJ7_SORBI|nr:hypothetical protein BDA96_08G113700 [Sorghum bicolor]
MGAALVRPALYYQAPNAGSDGTAAEAEDSSVSGASIAAEAAAPATPLNSSAAASVLNEDAGGAAAEVASPTALPSSGKSNTTSGAGEAGAPTPLHTSEPEASTLNVVVAGGDDDDAKAAAPILNNSFAPAVPSTMYLPPELPGVLPPIDRFQPRRPHPLPTPRRRSLCPRAPTLIKHKGSRRKASWKDPDGRIISATTRADILSGEANFADLTARHSDCSSARRGGDLAFSLLSCARRDRSGGYNG